MSVQAFKSALENAGFDKSRATKAAATILMTIEKELATKSIVNFKGIGKLEVVPNKLGNRKTPIGGSAAKSSPVRIRFVVSRELKLKIAAAYR